MRRTCAVTNDPVVVELSSSVTVTIPVTTAVGAYYLLACADDLGAIPESNESNNTAVNGIRPNNVRARKLKRYVRLF